MNASAWFFPFRPWTVALFVIARVINEGLSDLVRN